MADRAMTRESLAVLQALETSRDEHWPYDLATNVLSMRVATVHRILLRFLRDGLVERREEDEATAQREGHPRRTLYRITALGVTAYKAETYRLQPLRWIGPGFVP
jgi:DNA-binding PadR family transcriptional regulator